MYLFRTTVLPEQSAAPNVSRVAAVDDHRAFIADQVPSKSRIIKIAANRPFSNIDTILKIFHSLPLSMLLAKCAVGDVRCAASRDVEQVLVEEPDPQCHDRARHG